MRYRDRRHAGQELAVRLAEWVADADITHPVVLALPRGGVPVAAEIADALHAPLDVLVIGKIGVPGHQEFGIGAVTGDEPPLYDREALQMLGLGEKDLAAELAQVRAELHRREEVYRGDRPAPRVQGQSVIVVDDGLATGVTARAALRCLRQQNPARLSMAVPVCASAAAALIQQDADDVICLHQPHSLRAVGEWYEHFDPVTDDEVIEALGTTSGKHRK